MDDNAKIIVLSKRMGGGGSDAKLQNKEINITENGSQNVKPDSGYDGIKNIKITTQVSGGDADLSKYFKDSIGPAEDMSEGRFDSGVNQMIKTIPLVKVEGDSLYGAFSNFHGETIPLLDTSNVTNMCAMFNESKIKTIPQLNTSNVTNMGGMFKDCYNLITIPQLDTANVTNMAGMFEFCYNLAEVPQLDTTNVTNMNDMFLDCKKLTEIPLLNTFNVTDMGRMFSGCENLTTIPTLNTSNVTNMSEMFYECTILATIPQLDTTNVGDMDYMFNNCINLETIPQLNTVNVTNMDGMFFGCEKLTEVPMLNTSSVETMRDMFKDCNNLSNESLNNILAMCASAENYTDTKALTILGITEEQAEICKGLSNYQAFKDAGWTLKYIGYITGIELINPPILKYSVGESFEPAEMTFRVTMDYDDDNAVIVSSEEFEEYGITYDSHEFTEDEIGSDVSITFYYNNGGDSIGLLTSCTSEENYVKYLKILNYPEKTQYADGEYIDLNGLTLQKVYSNGDTENYDAQQIINLIESGEIFVTPSLNKQLTPSKYEINLRFGEVYVNIFIKVVKIYKELVSLKVTQLPYITEYRQGEYYDESGLELELTFEDSTTLNIGTNDFPYYSIGHEWVPLDEVGEKQVKYFLAYDENICTYVPITVIEAEAEVTGLSIITAPDKTEYIVGEFFDLTGMGLQKDFSDGTSTELYSLTPESLEAEGITYEPNGELTLDMTGIVFDCNGCVTEQPITVTEPETTIPFVGIMNFYKNDAETGNNVRVASLQTDYREDECVETFTNYTDEPIYIDWYEDISKETVYEGNLMAYANDTFVTTYSGEELETFSAENRMNRFLTYKNNSTYDIYMGVEEAIFGDEEYSFSVNNETQLTHINGKMNIIEIVPGFNDEPIERDVFERPLAYEELSEVTSVKLGPESTKMIRLFNEEDEAVTTIPMAERNVYDDSEAYKIIPLYKGTVTLTPNGDGQVALLFKEIAE